ncbi:MAG: glycine--tRNA ligase subunit beta [Rickettsiales bacterium]
MPDFLLELFSEEIPARMQQDAIAHLQNSLQKSLAVSASSGFVTPRRLAVIIKNLPDTQSDITAELKGPKIDAPEAALNGFLKKNNLTLEQLEKRDGVYFATTFQKGKPTAEILKTIIEEILEKFPWPKSMRWGSGSSTWVRPLHSILCIFDGKIVPVEFAGVKAGNVTYGHRFLAPQAITINKPEEYENALTKAFVIADRDKRKTLIESQIESIAKHESLITKPDLALLEEVVGLVEYPQVLVGKIDDKFMDLPPEVLTMVMRSHQKYFALKNQDGSLSSNFLITSNMTTDDKGKAIIAGNERVLRARFADGRFFWDTDRKKPLSEWAEGLETVTYHAKLGTVADKVKRIGSLAASISSHGSWVMGHETSITHDSGLMTHDQLVARAAELCKADLVTGMVGEFAELQGIMGRYYATAQKEPQQVADAIRDHYKPQGAGDNVPTAPVSICVALADKLDTLISMFAIGEKPTGSKDPFALRRAALGVIRILLENNIRLPLKPIFSCPPLAAVATHKAHEKLVKKTEEKLHEPHKIGKYLSVSETAYEDIPEGAADKLSASLLEFFHDRLKVQLKDSGVRHDVIDAVIAGDDDLVRIVTRAKAVQEFITTDDGANLLAAYKRAVNILNIEEKKDSHKYSGQELSESALTEDAEKSLVASLNSVAQIAELLEKEQYKQAMTMLATLRAPVDLFFEKIMVNVKDNELLRSNRLRLLDRIRVLIDGIADFSKIEG